MVTGAADPEPPDASLRWAPNARSASGSVETLRIRDGVDLVLSRIAPTEACDYHFVEPEDVFGIGFHLKGGARFDMEGEVFATRPLDVWAGAAPRGARSTFRLPAAGFQTVSVRFAPEAVRELVDRLGRGGLLDDMVRMSEQAVATARLAPLNADAARTVAAMFTCPYTGAARTLFLESCALALIAAQLEAASRTRPGPRARADARRMSQARAWLDAHLDAPPSIVELARIVGINDFKLKQAFKAAFGTTVFGYVRQRRMERAAAHLHGGMSVSAAAAAAGYDCPRCFADAFRRHFGILPSEVSRAALQNSRAPHIKLPDGAHARP